MEQNISQHYETHIEWALGEMEHQDTDLFLTPQTLSDNDLTNLTYLVLEKIIIRGASAYTRIDQGMSHAHMLSNMCKWLYSVDGYTLIDDPELRGTILDFLENIVPKAHIDVCKDLRRVNKELESAPLDESNYYGFDLPKKTSVSHISQI